MASGSGSPSTLELDDSGERAGGETSPYSAACRRPVRSRWARTRLAPSTRNRKWHHAFRHSLEARSPHWALAGVALLVASALPACSSGPERSVEAYCTTLEQEQERILADFEGQMAAAEGTDDEFLGALMALGAGLGAIGELEIYADKLAEVAPEEIRVDVEAVATSIEEQNEAAKDAASDPLGALGSALIGSLMSAGSFQRVGEWTYEHCGQGF